MAATNYKGLAALQTADAALKAAIDLAVSAVQALEDKVADLQAAAAESEDSQVSDLANDIQTQVQRLTSAFTQAAQSGVGAVVTDPSTSVNVNKTGLSGDTFVDGSVSNTSAGVNDTAAVAKAEAGSMPEDVLKHQEQVDAAKDDKKKK